MSIAITEDHRTLAATAADVLAKHDALGAARALLEGAGWVAGDESFGGSTK